MRREVAIFINLAAAERAGQAAVQETIDTYKVRRRYKRGACVGYAVQLKSPVPLAEHEPERFIME